MRKRWTDEPGRAARAAGEGMGPLFCLPSNQQLIHSTPQNHILFRLSVSGHTRPRIWCVFWPIDG
jgi:hypothetical protein